ncbi:hypothetical protein BDV25DRAFT_137192 [Aspergillus avenaceus]|uniref:Uncharacterized protein n=1 Tax=Aspergillus avenaceus TaxID=36643 RepID=A0A5N6U3M2_ASPAV|nr:hypothetical protein BDV25DRAFT_137192 [Aspergillus avenaceus]
MDFLKSAIGKDKGGEKKGESGSSSSGDKDYLDKGLDSLENKFGGGKIDPNSDKVRQTNEKITDTAREKFEGATGKKVPEKFSN